MPSDPPAQVPGDDEGSTDPKTPVVPEREVVVAAMRTRNLAIMAIVGVLVAASACLVPIYFLGVILGATPRLAAEIGLAITLVVGLVLWLLNSKFRKWTLGVGRAVKAWTIGASDKFFAKWGEEPPWGYRVIVWTGAIPAAVLWLTSNPNGQAIMRRINGQRVAHALVAFPQSLIIAASGVGAAWLLEKLRTGNAKRKSSETKLMDELHRSLGNAIFAAAGAETEREALDELATLVATSIGKMADEPGELRVRILMDGDDGHLLDKAHYPHEAFPRTTLATIDDPNSAARRAMRDVAICVVPDVSTETRKGPGSVFLWPKELGPAPEGSHISFPITRPDRPGVAIGVITIWSDRAQAFGLRRKDLFARTLKYLTVATFAAGPFRNRSADVGSQAPGEGAEDPLRG